ncbi:hypothetical protein [Crenothrix polyspora]|uniref:Uncharacterized protein n=1 Tax=Crenothrix polyspora TaxID=360316 RepID=A0A1R4H121_9GAMM|nr:hypothetical protein [Crenothrix polyspora]SJM89750.1 hypothetical protein CRENPOLYSF1_120009 [Crenothrix polyspora]
MKIWYGTILVTTVVLTSYLVIVMGKHLPMISQDLAMSQESLKTLQEQLTQQNTLLEALQADVKALSGNKSGVSVPKPSQDDKRKAAIEALRSGFAKLTEAEAKHKQGDLTIAVDSLKASKQALWQAGDVLTSDQDALRALMTPIDVIISQWKKGDKTADSLKISTAVKTILQKLDGHS